MQNAEPRSFNAKKATMRDSFFNIPASSFCILHSSFDFDFCGA